MKKIFIYLLIIIIVFITFLNLGKWIDTTQKPIKSDFIVCLGGGTAERLNMAVHIFNDGYSKSESIMLIGESYNTKEYLDINYPYTPIEQHHNPKNTKEEVLYIKRFMLKNGYETALVVTDPSHSGRVSILNAVLSIEGDSDITLRIVSSKVNWWKPEKYYDDKRSGEAVLSEAIRILYSIFCYAILEKLGVECD